MGFRIPQTRSLVSLWFAFKGSKKGTAEYGSRPFPGWFKILKDGGFPVFPEFLYGLFSCGFKQRPEALYFFDQMAARGISPDVISCSALISACADGARWELGLALLTGMAHGSSGEMGGLIKRSVTHDDHWGK